MTFEGQARAATATPVAATITRVGAVGDFGRAHFGELLAPRVLEAELRRRLGPIEFRWFSEGAEPLPMDGGFTAEPLPVPEEQLDFLLRWDGPELAFLADRVFSPELLDQRVADLRLLNRLPSAPGPLVVVQGGNGCVDAVDEVAATVERTGLEAVVVEAVPCEGGTLFADALGARIDCCRVPAPGVEDVLAVVREAGLVLASSDAVLATASAFGVPYRSLGPSPLEGSPEEADRRLDEIAAEVQPIHGVEPPDIEPLRVAHLARGRRVLEERLRWLDRHEQLERELASVRSERDHARAHARWLEGQLEAIWHSKSWRLLKPGHALARLVRKLRR